MAQTEEINTGNIDIAEVAERAARAREAAEVNAGRELPWSRLVVIGDSFAEGLGDPEPAYPGGLRGWADRVAEVFAKLSDDFAYANLAVRGKVITQVIDEQLEEALALHPDLIIISAGGNDVLRMGSDPDLIARKQEKLLSAFAKTGATIVVFTSIDVAKTPVMRALRGKVAIFNENLRALAAKYDAVVVDQWRLTELQDLAFWAEDRLHLNALGHHTVAREVLNALNVPHDLQPLQPEPAAPQSWREARREDAVWARTHLVPWVIRRLRGVSSGDNISAKRPEARPMFNEQSDADSSVK